MSNTSYNIKNKVLCCHKHVYGLRNHAKTILVATHPVMIFFQTIKTNSHRVHTRSKKSLIIGFLLSFYYLNAKLTKTLHHGFIKLKILQAFKHLIDALFLLFHIRMHIKIKCCSFPFQFCLIVIKAFLNVNLSYNVPLIKIVLCYIFSCTKRVLYSK